MSAPYLIDELDPQPNFPPVELACREPNGLLAIGGDLSVTRLRAAYQQGIFPWFNEDQPILWWSPDPRAVLFPGHIKISKSFRKFLNKQEYTVTFDTCFRRIIAACAEPRAKQAGTWILPELIDAYEQLHQQGYAHSVECWCEAELVGGLYGVAVGQIFCGESMFCRRSNASKVALLALSDELIRRGFVLIDCQQDSEHLRSLGSELIPRHNFTELLKQYCDLGQNLGKWTESNG